MALYHFLMLYPAFIQNVLKDVFLTGALHFVGSHSGAHCEEILMIVTNYRPKKENCKS